MASSMNSSKRRWATGGSFADDAAPSGSDSDSDSDSEDDAAAARPAGAVTLLALPTAGGLRARKSSGAVVLPSAGGDSDSDEDDGFGEGVAMLVTSSRCPSRRDSRRIGFGHEVSTSAVHKDDKALMRLQDEAERKAKRRAEQDAQEEAERKAKVQDEGICISEVISMFATGGLAPRPGTASRPEPEAEDSIFVSNPTLSPAGASVSGAAADDADEDEEPSPPWSDTDAADRPSDFDAGSDAEEEVDAAFGSRSGRRKSVVQFPGWTANPAKDATSVSSAPVTSSAESSSAGGAETWQAEAAPVDDDTGAERAAAADAEAAQQARLIKMVAAEAPTAREPEPVGVIDYAEAAADAADDEVDDVSEAVSPKAQWAETGLPQAWETSEGAEMEFVDEMRARQMEQLLRSGRMPVPSAPSGFQSARSQSRERGSARPTSRGFHASLAAADPTVGMDMMPRPPPKRSGSPSPPTGRRPAPPPKAGGGAPGGRVMAGRTVRGGRTVAAAAPPAAPPVCV